MKQNNYKPQIPDVMEAIFDACTYCEFASACHFENGCGSDRMEYIKATKNDEFWQYIDEVNGEGAHENG